MASKIRNAARLEHIADIATRWIGSTSSLLVHTLLFIVSFLLPALHVTTFDKMLLVLTTLVSLEAIYLAIFIQMTVNKNSLDIENIQEDIEEIQEDVEEMQEDVEEIQEDVEEIQEDMEELQENAEEDTPAIVHEPHKGSTTPTPDQKLLHIQQLLQQLQQEIEALKEQR
ncbi:DUF1003 domain-containing protein [Niabella soli]|uniref:Membrane protein n=1 Tax=Niabella soli DSM 19437 TaxID=929713 RepID=W0F030_9BACT|nr:DUF1003 domain-containing protein [Niabella soli]AHF16367.1 membrane protein [Niabella soli DSM 19437]